MNRREALKALVQTAAGVAIGVRIGVDEHTLLSSDRVPPEEWVGVPAGYTVGVDPATDALTYRGVAIDFRPTLGD